MSPGPTRRAAGALLAAATLAAGGLVAVAPVCAVAAQVSVTAAEAVMGDPKAPVTVVEYASVGCPHCAVWANEVFPDFRAKYIDTGKVRFVFREMLTGNGELAAVGFMTARCAPPERYFQVVDDIFASQATIGRDGIEALAVIAAHAGLARDRLDACLRDDAALKALNERTSADAQAHKVTGTPTFFVGTERMEGEQSLEALDAAIARARH